MKVAELNGALLDQWVACSSGLKAFTILGSSEKSLMLNDESAEFGCITYQPSKDWATAGPIITRERISLQWTNTNWRASKILRGKSIIHSADSPLIAAMRCFVESRFGPEVLTENGNPANIKNRRYFASNLVERRSPLPGPLPNGVERRLQQHYRI
jgi:hypothetical protein